MDSILVTGGSALHGEIPIAGAKNACLTLMPATLLSEEPITLTNAPRLSDIKTMGVLLESLGTEVTSMQDGKVLTMTSHNLDNLTADYDIVRKMRASVCLLGPLVARLRRAEVSIPGGCVIGPRPIDLHIKGLQKLNCKVDIANGYVHVDASAIKGGPIFLVHFPISHQAVLDW